MEEQLPPCRISSSSPAWQPACAPSLQTNVMEITASTPQQRMLSVLGTSETCWCQQQGKLALSLIPAGQNIRDNEDRMGSPRPAGKQTCDSLAQQRLSKLCLKFLPGIFRPARISQTGFSAKVSQVYAGAWKISLARQFPHNFLEKHRFTLVVEKLSL